MKHMFQPPSAIARHKARYRTTDDIEPEIYERLNRSTKKAERYRIWKHVEENFDWRLALFNMKQALSKKRQATIEPQCVMVGTSTVSVFGVLHGKSDLKAIDETIRCYAEISEHVMHEENLDLSFPTLRFRKSICLRDDDISRVMYQQEKPDDVFDRLLDISWSHHSVYRGYDLEKTGGFYNRETRDKLEDVFLEAYEDSSKKPTLRTVRQLISYENTLWPMYFPEIPYVVLRTARSLLMGQRAHEFASQQCYSSILLVTGALHEPEILAVLRDPTVSLVDLLYHRPV